MAGATVARVRGNEENRQGIGNREGGREATVVRQSSGSDDDDFPPEEQVRETRRGDAAQPPDRQELCHSWQESHFGAISPVPPDPPVPKSEYSFQRLSSERQLVRCCCLLQLVE